MPAEDGQEGLVDVLSQTGGEGPDQPVEVGADPTGEEKDEEPGQEPDEVLLEGPRQGPIG